MEVKIIDDLNTAMVKKKTKRYTQNGWKKNGEIRYYVKHIPHFNDLDKIYKSKVYYQEVIK